MQFTPVTIFDIPEKYHGDWHHHLQAEIMNYFVDKYRQDNEALLVFVKAKNDVGKTKTVLGISIIALNPELEAKYSLNDKWLVIHELSHLFGAADLRQPNNIMDEESLGETLIQSASKRTYDETTRSIMKAAIQYTKKQKQHYFSFRNSSFQDGEPLVPLYKFLFTFSRSPQAINSEIGAFYLIHNQYSQALEYLDQSLKLIQQNQDEKFQDVAVDLVRYNKGLSLYYLKRFQEAFQCFQTSLEEGPPDANKYFYVGLAYQMANETNRDWSQEQIDYLLAVFNRSAEMNPDFSWVWFKIAEIQLCSIPLNEWSSDAVEAVKSNLQKCLTLEPTHPYALLFTGVILQNQGKAKEAQPIIKKAINAGADISKTLRKQGGSVGAITKVP